VYTQNATYWNKVIYDSPSLLYPFEWAFLCCSLAFKVRAFYLKAIVVWDYYCIIFFFSHHRELMKSVGSSDGSLVTTLCCGEGHFVHLERLCVADVIKYRKTSCLFIAYLLYPLHKEGSNLSESES
jgi:hypothetical protein